jgi:purine-binding chemotaxis protein CheW
MNNLPTIGKQHNDTRHEIIQLVSFELGGEDYGIDVLSVREIIRTPSITKMPNAPDSVDGIINLRGTVVPIHSLRRRFGLDVRQSDRLNRILVMEAGDGLAGFMVDAVAEVIRISASEIQPPPGVVRDNANKDCILGVINHGERLLVVLDLKQLCTEEMGYGN